MRFAVCFFGLVASSLTAAIGAGFLLWDSFLAWLIENVPQDILQSAGMTDSSTSSMTGISYPNAALVVLVAAAYGFIGSFLVLFRCGKQGGALLLIPALFAAFVNPVSIAVTWFAMLIGLLAMFVGPLPLNSPQEADDEDEKEAPRSRGNAKPAMVEEDEEEDMPKPRGKAKPPMVQEDAEVEEEMPKPKPKAKGKPKKVIDDDD